MPTQAPTDSDLGFPAKGSLKRVPFAFLVRDIARTRTTGNLYLLAGETKKVVFFVDGRPTIVRSNMPQEFLGQILTDQGLITQEQCDNTLEAIRRTGKKQGELLVEMGILSEGNLRYGLDEQVRIKLFEIFGWEDGRFQFKLGGEPSGPATGLALETPVETVIVAGVQERWTDERARAALKPFADRYPVVHARWAADATPIDLLPEELYFLRCLDGSRTVDELLAKKTDPEVPQVSTLLFGLIAAGVVEPGEDRQNRRLAPPRPNLTPPTLADDVITPKFEQLSAITEYEDTPLPNKLPGSAPANVTGRNARVPVLPTEDEEMFRGLDVDESIVADARVLRGQSGERNLNPLNVRATAPAPTPTPASRVSPLDETDFGDLRAADDETDFSDLVHTHRGKTASTTPEPTPVKPDSVKSVLPQPSTGRADSGKSPPPARPDSSKSPAPTRPDSSRSPAPTKPDSGRSPLPQAQPARPTPTPPTGLPRPTLGAPTLGAPLGAPTLGAPLGAPTVGAPTLGAPTLGAPPGPRPAPAPAPTPEPLDDLADDPDLGDDLGADLGDDLGDIDDEIEMLDDEEMLEDGLDDDGLGDAGDDDGLAAQADDDDLPLDAPGHDDLPLDDDATADEATADDAAAGDDEPADDEPAPDDDEVLITDSSLTDTSAGLPDIDLAEPAELGALPAEGDEYTDDEGPPPLGAEDDLLGDLDDDLVLADGEELPDLDDLDLDADADLGDAGLEDEPALDEDADLGDPDLGDPDLGDDDLPRGSDEDTDRGFQVAGGIESAEALGATRFSQGEEAMREGDYDQAVALFEDAYANGFDLPDLHAHLAFARFRASGNDPSSAPHALELLDWAEQAEPGLPIIHAYRGAIYVGLGRAEEAAECFDRALYLDPENELALEYTRG